MMEKSDSKEKEIDEREKELVIARIEAQMSPNLRLSVGETGSLDRDEMIEHVKQGDNVGIQIVEAHLNFIKAQTSGQIVTALTSLE